MRSGVKIVPDPKKTVEISPSVFIVLYCYTRPSIPNKKLSSPFLNVYFFNVFIYLILLHWVWMIFQLWYSNSQFQHLGSSSLTRDQTQVPCFKSIESQPLDHQGSPGIILNIQGSIRASLVAHTVKNLPAMQQTQVQSLGQEGPLEKGMATHSSILAWKIPWTEEPGGLQSMGLHRVRHG